MSLGPWLLNYALFQLFVFISTILHELGHVFAGRLVGFRVFGIEIGRGRVIGEFLFGGLRWQFRTILFGGFAHGAPRNTYCYKLSESVFTLGGPMANILLLVGSVLALRLDASITSGPFKGCVPVTMLLLSNAALLVYSLWPHRYETRFGKLPNDLLLLWETWRRPRAQVEQLPAHWFFLEGQESQRRGDHEAARKWIEDGLSRYPSNYFLLWLQAFNLTDLARYKEARLAYVRLLGKYSKSEELRHTAFNGIAYVNVLSGDAQLLEEAEICSRLAFERHPWNFYFKGTRGIVLVELGHHEEGLKLLRQALKQHTERQALAMDACFIAMAEARLGKLTESQSLFAMARRLDPKCFLLTRENQLSPPAPASPKLR